MDALAEILGLLIEQRRCMHCMSSSWKTVAAYGHCMHTAARSSVAMLARWTRTYIACQQYDPKVISMQRHIHSDFNTWTSAIRELIFIEA